MLSVGVSWQEVGLCEYLYWIWHQQNVSYQGKVRHAGSLI